MTWAKIVEGEVVQVYDGDPTNHWHPDALALWEDVPNDLGIAEGWHRDEDGKWHSGPDWMAIQAAANPIPPEGPPSAVIQHELEDLDATTMRIKFTAQVGGSYDEENPAHIPTWDINNGETTSNEWEVSVDFTKTNAIQTIPVSLVVVGTGGESEAKVEEISIPPARDV